MFIGKGDKREGKREIKKKGEGNDHVVTQVLENSRQG